MMQRVRSHEDDICQRQSYEQVPDPFFLMKGRVYKIKDEPCDSEGYDAYHDHTKSVDHREIVYMAHHGYGVQKRPYKDLYAEQEKAAKPAVAHVAEPKQPQDIGKRTTYYQ